MYSLLFFLFIIVVGYKVYQYYSVKEGFYYSVNPCFTNDTPYIKFNNKYYVCFDNKNKLENTLTVFYGKDKECYIDPKKSTMTFYDLQGGLIDTITEVSNKSCNPAKVNIT